MPKRSTPDTCPGSLGSAVKTLLLSAAISMAIALLGTPVAIRFFIRHGVGQEIQDELAAAGHATKRGTPTMGGIVFVLATLVGYLAGHLLTGERPTASGVLVLFLMTGMGLVGFVDDFIKVFRRRSLGLRAGQKLFGQIVVGAVFGVLALHFPDRYDLTPASDHLSFLGDFGIGLGSVFFVIWVILMTGGTSNGVNLVDGLDGLATGATIPVLVAYVIIGNWQLRNACATSPLVQNCYDVRDPLDLAVVAAALLGACFGFLWWNAPPAKIFMGDVGSLALGGALSGLAIVSRTELLLPILGGLFVIVTLSVMIQVSVFKVTRIRTGKPVRVFRMAPLQHHFRLGGWSETTIVVRFWLIAALFVMAGLGIFYVGWS
jgi:phospho-N-acetylmuramoyl-pentapeptide-transferase